MNIGWIADGIVPEYKQFTEEPKAKRARRHKKYAKEALEAAAIKRDMAKKNKANGNGSLEQQLMKRQAEREAGSNNFFDHLLAKYGGADDSEEYEIPAKKKKKVAAKTPSKAASKTPSKAAKKATTKATVKTPTKSSPKTPINKVKSGRVSKRK